MKRLASGYESLGCRPMIDPDRREGIEVQAQNLVAPYVIRSLYRIGKVHGEIVANAERGETQLRTLPYQLHVHGQGCITRIIKIAILALDHESARIAAIRPVRQTAGVNGVYKFGSTKIKGVSATMVQ